MYLSMIVYSIHKCGVVVSYVKSDNEFSNEELTLLVV